MTDLLLHGKRLDSVFELLGAKENDLTYSLGWALSRCPSLLGRILAQLLPDVNREAAREIRLQHGGRDRGYTDVEVLGDGFHIIIEAKRGWALPSTRQLSRYASRLQRSKARTILVSLSECSHVYAQAWGPGGAIDALPLRHMNWADILAMASHGHTHAEKRLLAEFRVYIRRFVTMKNEASNWVYVVALSPAVHDGGLTYIDIVEKRGLYFHPFGWGGGWPKEPPNYLGFRYGGRLQGIRHVERHEITRNLHDFFPEFTDKDNTRGPFMVYRLGPVIRPPSDVKTGRIFRSGRVWAMLDLLLTCKTIAEARNKSDRRMKGTP